MKFTAEIELGNAGMTRPADVLSAICNAMVNQVDPWEDLEIDQGSLIDANGNTVGKWEVVE